ncbi:MAG: winged helix DNA-binding domain-containing protein [Alphaproteobacteria bacterium]|nr:winged helix DNA-binding domain-containing protein [Alphaproteobacteria bacterium]
MDAALADGRLWVSPGVRGCIWVVPRADLSLALRVGDGWYRKRTLREMQRLAVSPEELAALGQAVLAALAEGPLTPEALRAALPEGSWRALGEAGKKLGHSTTLPTALRLLEGEGHIRRFQDVGRLDTQRYAWALAEQNLLSLGESPEDPRAQARLLAERLLRWSAPLTQQELVDWSLLGKRAAAQALADAGAVAVQVEGMGEAFVLPEQALDAAVDERVHLLPTLDNLFAHRSPIATMMAPDWHGLQVSALGRRTQALATVTWLRNRPVLHRGELVGFWEFDPDRQEVVLGGRGLPEAAQAEAVAVGAFIREELGGSAFTYSQDSEARLRDRAAWTRALR